MTANDRHIIAALILLFVCGVLGVFGSAASSVKAPEGPYLMFVAGLALGWAFWLIARAGRDG